MDKYTIVISGEGPHHNPPPNEGDPNTDGNAMAARFVSSLKGCGHTINSAIFNTETTTDDLDALTRYPDAGQDEVKGVDPSMTTTDTMKVFKFEAKEGDDALDTLYVQGETEEAARQTFKDRGFDDMPDSMLTVTESVLPEDEVLLNP